MPGLTLRIAALDDRSDETVLAAYSREQDTAAFATLIHRHGGLILGVCRRMIRDRHLAEDAFQAVCVILARKARDIRPAGGLSAWLYGVSVRVARRARAIAARQARRERPMTTLPYLMTHDPEPDDLAGLIDEAIEALPETLRSAVILCEIDGRSRAEAAKILGIPQGTLSSRLAAARKKLAIALHGRGLVLPFGALVLSASVSPKLLAQAMKSLSAESTLTPTIQELVRGGLAMSLIRKWNLGVVLMMLVCGGGALGLAQQPKAPQPPAAAVEAKDPVWERFKSICGDTKESRAMFEEMMGDEKQAIELRQADQTDETATVGMKKNAIEILIASSRARNDSTKVHLQNPDTDWMDKVYQAKLKEYVPRRVILQYFYLSTRQQPEEDHKKRSIISLEILPLFASTLNAEQRPLVAKLLIANANLRKTIESQKKFVEFAIKHEIHEFLPTARIWLEKDAERKSNELIPLVVSLIDFMAQHGEDLDRKTIMTYRYDIRRVPNVSHIEREPFDYYTLRDVVMVQMLKWKKLPLKQYGIFMRGYSEYAGVLPFFSDEKRQNAYALTKPVLDEIEKELKKSSEK